MKLVSCYISGFGQIKEYAYDFSEGLDAICQENGWGKTTFSVFIKAMFYGMEYSARTKALTERKHYLPWDGSSCGGNLVFEVNGKQYRVERTFGRRDKDDTFALVDVLTGMPSTDFSENLGEELFQVDRESFEKSIFIPQSAIATAMTDSLNAKMGDLASAKDDINNFDAAVSRVAEVRKNYTRKSEVNNGKLNIIKDELSKCNEIVDKKPAVLDGYYKQNELLEEKKKKLNWLEAEKNRVAELIRLQSKKEQDMGAYRQQLEFLTKQQGELSQLDDFFANGVPTADEQVAMEDVERQHDISRRTESDLYLKFPLGQQAEKWSELFADGVPSKYNLDHWNAKALNIQELQMQGKHAKLSEDAEKQLDDLRHFFSRKMPTQEELSKVEHDVMELSMVEGRIAEQDEIFRNLKAKKEIFDQKEKEGGQYGSVILLICLCVAFFVGAFAFHFFLPDSGSSRVLQIVCFGGAAATLVAGVMQFMRIRGSRRNKYDELEQRLLDASVALEQCKAMKQELTDGCKLFLSDFMLTPAESMQQMVYEIRVNLDRYLHLLEEEQQATESSTGAVEEMADVRLELYTALGHFADVYKMDLYHEGCELALLEQLKKDIAGYEEYQVNLKQMDLLKATILKQEQLLNEYVNRFPGMENMSVTDSLKTIRSSMESYERIQEDIKNLQENMKQFSEESLVEEEVHTVEELQEQQEKIDEEIKELNQGITQDRETIITLGDELDSIEDAENRREVLLEKRLEYERKVELLTKTEEFLQIAKEQFLSKYMMPLRKGMDHYMTLLDEGYKGESSNMDFDITMDLSVQVIYSGATHSSDYLSRGYQDLVALCARFALVDVLYQKEQPMIILDDPFINLDEDKTKRGLALLQEIAKERQIIYFTCHESRMV